MKNYLPSRPSTNFLKDCVSLSIIVVLVFDIVFPALAFADTEVLSDENLNPSEIVTGDAVAGLTLESEINNNLIDTNESTTPELMLDENYSSSTDETFTDSATTTTDEIATSTSTSTAEDITDENEINFSNSETTVTATNTASSSNVANITANTGNNTTENGNFVTETGDAVAYVDLVNVMNTNIVNSTGLIDFIRDVLGYENFDMRDVFSDIFNALSTAETTVPCGKNVCDTASLLVDLTNQTNIYNDVSVIADTGNNNSTGSSNIQTGDAYANANIINLANTNIIDSNYLLLVFNNFEDMAGSLVLPNSDFFSTYFNQSQSNVNSFTATNNVSVNNNIDTLANTGDNTISGIGTSTIVSGEAIATSHVENSINQNLINSNSFSMLIRVSGTWSGNIFGLPEGMKWENTNNGIRLYYENSGNTDNNTSISKITNDANITNNVQVYALTGDNKITNSSNDSVIETGEAYADSTIFNIANTNIVGSNWINLIFNIYGNWSGNLAFGQPDLWLGLSHQNGNRQIARPGGEMSYTYTIFNRGDTTAHNVMLENNFPLSSLTFNNAPTSTATTTDGKSIWSIGDIKAGETKEITVNAKINNNFGARNQSPLPLNAKVYGDQPDANELDNSDSLLLYVSNKSKKNDDPKTSFPAKFVIEKSADKTFANAGDIVNYTIKLINKGGPIYDALLVDSLKDEKGNIITDQTWPLDTIKNGETIIITYSITLQEDITHGIYTNTAQLVGLDSSPVKKYRTPYESPIVTHKLEVGTGPKGAVLGLSTSVSSCSPYITTYLRQYRNNNEIEVTKLQNFLKQYVNNEIVVTGIFDDSTRIAIEKFQQQYAEDILTPWNMTKSSGYVYYTTQKKINEIMCGGTTEFPLTNNQEKEIDYFKQNNTNTNHQQFGLKLPTVDLSESTNTNNQPITTVQPVTNLFFFQFNKPKDLYYSQLDKWLTLFKKTETAFLNY